MAAKSQNQTFEHVQNLINGWPVPDMPKRMTIARAEGAKRTKRG